MRDGKFDLTLFGHRGSISHPYDTLEMYHSRNAFDVGRPTLFPARWSNADYDKFVEQAAKIPPNDPRLIELVKGAMEIWMREGPCLSLKSVAPKLFALSLRIFTGRQCISLQVRRLSRR